MKTNFLKVAVFAASMFFQNVFYAQAQIDPSFSLQPPHNWGTFHGIEFLSWTDANGISRDKIIYSITGSPGVPIGIRRSNLDGTYGQDDDVFNTNSAQVVTTTLDKSLPQINANGEPTGNIYVCRKQLSNPAPILLSETGTLISTFNVTLTGNGSNHWCTAAMNKVESGENYLYFGRRHGDRSVFRCDPVTGNILSFINFQQGAGSVAIHEIVNLAPNRILVVGSFTHNTGLNTYRNIILLDNDLEVVESPGLAFSSIDGIIGDVAELNGNIFIVGRFLNINGTTFPNRIARLDLQGSDNYLLNTALASSFQSPLGNLSHSSLYLEAITVFNCNVVVGGNVGSRGIMKFSESGNFIEDYRPINAIVTDLTLKYLNDGDGDIELMACGAFTSVLGAPRFRVVQFEGFSINPSYKYCAIPNGSFQMDYEVSSGGLQPNETQEWLLEESLDNGLTWNSLGDVFSGLEGGVITSQNGILYRLTRTVSSCATSCQFSSVFGDVQLGCGPYQVVESETKSFSTENENGTEVSTLTVFPNPFSDRMSISAQEFNNDDVVDVIIFDVNGAQVYTAEKQFAGDLQNGIDVSNLAAGAYLVVLKSKTAVYSYKALKK